MRIIAFVIFYIILTSTSTAQVNDSDFLEKYVTVILEHKMKSAPKHYNPQYPCCLINRSVYLQKYSCGYRRFAYYYRIQELYNNDKTWETLFKRKGIKLDTLAMDNLVDSTFKIDSLEEYNGCYEFTSQDSLKNKGVLTFSPLLPTNNENYFVAWMSASVPFHDDAEWLYVLKIVNGTFEIIFEDYDDYCGLPYDKETYR